jgi:UPF0716 protein FxsA
VFYRIIILLILIPVVETTLLLLIGFYTQSVLIPLAIILLSGLVGSWFSRRQGFSVYRRIETELAAGRMPTDAMIDGVLIFLAGILLVMPGVLTDILGATMLIPPLRAMYRRKINTWVRRTFHIKTVDGQGFARSEVIESYIVEKQSPDDIGDQV